MERQLPTNLEDAINNPDRFSEHKVRDAYQHPLETLNFFGLNQKMTVLEIAPGAGYYTEILAPYLAPEGQYMMAVPRIPSRRSRTLVLVNNEKKIQEIIMRFEAVKKNIRFIPLELPDERNKTKTEFADMVVVFNNIHNFVAKNEAKMVFELIHATLKPHGLLGITQHRISEHKKNLPQSGYMTESEVIHLARAAGFKLLKKSEINANPKDTADYPTGVWTLPPIYRLGDQDHSKYEKIGESDRMTLLLMKE